MRFQQEMSSMAMQASTAESNAEALVSRLGKRVTEEVWENQRFYHVIGWSEKLLGTDRCVRRGVVGVCRHVQHNMMPNRHQCCTMDGLTNV